MKNPVLVVLILLFVLLAFSITVSCTRVQTVTVDKTFTILENPVKAVEIQPVRLTVTVTKTITTTLEGVATTITLEPVVYMPIFERPAPDIPHVYIINMEHTGIDWYDDEGPSVCWICHNIPFEHEIWLENTEVCMDCHTVVDNPVLTYYN